MSSKQFNVAIIGLGFGAEFIPIYQRHPQANMYAICQRTEASLNEIGDKYGIETRYPFLDKNVVQEFLWLKPELKNSQYKSVIDNYFMKNNFSFSRGKKIGF